MDPLDGDVRELTNEGIHDRLLQFLHSYGDDITEDEYTVLEEAGQRLLDMS